MARSVRVAPAHPVPTLLAAVLAVVLAGCAVPVPEPPDPADRTPAAGGEGTALPTADVGGAALIAQLAAVDAAVAEVAAALDAAAGAGAAGDLAAARTAGDAAVGLLLGTEEVAGLLPSGPSDRSTRGTDDLVSATVTLAGDVGGERARVVLELVRDPLVGDLGAWQRDAPGVIAAVRAAVAAAGADPAALDAALAGTAGELTRTLGYALATAAAPDAALAAHAAGAGAARLAVVRVALDLGTVAVAGDGA